MKKVTFKPKEDIYWDNWGTIVRVFVEGRTYEGELDDDYLYAETPYYENVGDSIDLDSVVLL